MVRGTLAPATAFAGSHDPAWRVGAKDSTYSRRGGCAKSKNSNNYSERVCKTLDPVNPSRNDHIYYSYTPLVPIDVIMLSVIIMSLRTKPNSP